MPGAVARTSTIALSNAVTPYLMQLTNKGWAKACFDNPHLKNGLSIHDGMITNEAVAQSFGKSYVNPDQLINADQFL